MQRFGNTQRGLQRQRRIEFGPALAKFDQSAALVAYPYLDDAGSGMLPADARCSAPESEQHGVRRDGRMADKRCFFARVEETQADVVIGRGRGRYECHFGLCELACDRFQGGIVLAVGIEDHGRRVARETGARESIDLK